MILVKRNKCIFEIVIDTKAEQLKTTWTLTEFAYMCSVYAALAALTTNLHLVPRLRLVKQ
jgi:hypothetical protein